MKISHDFDYQKVPQGTPFTVRLMLTAEGKAPEGSARRPLNLAVVLDRSGSMGGEKLRNVKEATRILVEKMGGEDRLSITTFDNEVTPLVEPTVVNSNGRAIASAVDGIRSRGSTFLAGGYKQGCAFAREHEGESCMTRVLLLTDGLANVGMTDPREFGDLAARMNEAGITTTTIGVGRNYNEELLGMMAERGGGGTYFIERPDEAQPVFNEELGFLQSLAAAGLTASLRAADGIGAEQLNSYVVKDDGAWRIGDIYGGVARSLVLELRLPAVKESGPLSLGALHVSWREAGEDGFEEKNAEIPLTVDVIDKEQFDKVTPHPAVTLEAALLTAARARVEAMAMADAQRFDEAADLLEGVAAGLAALEIEDPLLHDQLKELRERALRLRRDRERYYTRNQRKRMYTEHQHLSKGEMLKYSSMMSRRHDESDLMDEPRLPEPGRGLSFRCYVAQGHLVAETDEGRFLVDTGAQFSVAGSGRIRIGRKTHRVRPDFLGHGPDELGRLIGVRISGVIGADILGRSDVLIDLPRDTITFFKDAPAQRGEGIPFRKVQGIPLIKGVLGGEKAGLLISTGAKLSYLSAGMADTYDVVGEDTDFYAGFGEFRTEVREVPVSLGNRRFTLRFGALPEMLEMALGLAGAQGIIGAELCFNNSLLLSGRGKRLYFG